MALLPCPSCARHVRSTDAECPFCQHSIGVREAPTVDWSAYRSRAALASFVAAVAGAACTPVMQQQEVHVIQQQHVVVQQPEPVVVQQQVIVQQPDPVIVQPVQPDPVIVVRPARPQPVVQPQPVVVQPDPCCTAVPAYGISPYNPTDPGATMARYGAPPPPDEI
jgi:hypothetical protein